MIITLTKEDYKVLLENRLKKLEDDIKDIANSYHIATEILKDSIYEENEEKEAYYRKMSEMLHDKLKDTSENIDKTSFVYINMFGKPMKL